MLVAPLMTPIMAAAAATVTAQNPRLWRALAVVTLGTVLANEEVKDGRYVEATRAVLQRHNGLWFNDASYVISRRRR